MNTANLQLEGLYMALSAILDALRSKGLLSGTDIELALLEAEKAASSTPQRQLSPANLEAICFPFRYLRAANRAGAEHLSFAEVAVQVAQQRALCDTR